MNITLEQMIIVNALQLQGHHATAAAVLKISQQ